MPFNAAMTGLGGVAYILDITVEDLISTYDVEDEVLAKYGTNTQEGDTVQLRVAGVNVVAATTSQYAIDGDGLNDSALLEIVLASGAFIAGRGGNGGMGGWGEWDFESDEDNSSWGFPGANGGTAIRLGCDTRFRGPGVISNGFGGGGGGGGYGTIPSAGGGGGGGGGAPLGVGAPGGPAIGPGNVSGSPGETAGVTTKGAGGAGGSSAGDGGDGGDSSPSAPEQGTAGSQPGGAAGSNGLAIETQGFLYTIGSGVTVEGSIT